MSDGGRAIIGSFANRKEQQQTGGEMLAAAAMRLKSVQGNSGDPVPDRASRYRKGPALTAAVLMALVCGTIYAAADPLSGVDEEVRQFISANSTRDDLSPKDRLRVTAVTAPATSFDKAEKFE